MLSPKALRGVLVNVGVGQPRVLQFILVCCRVLSARMMSRVE
jgi:hypothetical protein